MAVIDSMAIRIVTNARAAAGDMKGFSKAVEVAGKVSGAAAPPVKLVGEYLEKIGPGGTAKIAGSTLVFAAGSMELLARRAGSTQRPMRSLLGMLGRLAMFFVPGGAIAKGVLVFGAVTAGLYGTAKAARAARDAFLEYLATYDQMAKVGRKLGIATEALGGLRHAAEQTAGVSTGVFDTAMQRMVRRVAEAAHGTGEAVNALRDLRLDARQLAAMSPDMQFLAIADAMRSVDTQGDRVRLTMKLFDTEGVALVNTLTEGSDKLRDFMREASRLGIAPDSATTGAVEAFNDQMDRTRKVWQGVRAEINATFLPMKRLFSWGSQKLGEWVLWFSKIGSYFALFKFLPSSDKKPSNKEPQSPVAQALTSSFQRQELVARSAGDLETYSAARRNLSGSTATPLQRIVENTRQTVIEIQRLKDRQNVIDQVEGELSPYSMDMGI